MSPINYKRKYRFVTYKTQLLRLLHITKPIELSEAEQKLIKLCKLHYESDARFANKHGWIEILKPMFVEIYGWNPDEDGNYNRFLGVIFSKLLDVHIKIQLDQSGSNRQLKDIFFSAFEVKKYIREEKEPIERAISELCGLIQGNPYKEYGVVRYKL